MGLFNENGECLKRPSSKPEHAAGLSAVALAKAGGLFQYSPKRIGRSGPIQRTCSRSVESWTGSSHCEVEVFPIEVRSKDGPKMGYEMSKLFISRPFGNPCLRWINATNVEKIHQVVTGVGNTMQFLTVIVTRP